MNIFFNPKDVYYQIEELDKIWSTKRAVFVEQTDTELKNFIATGNQLIPLETEAQLIETLEIYSLPRGIFAPMPTFEEARMAKLAEINAGYESVMAYVQAGYPQSEVISWPVQASQARELAQNEAAPALFVRSLAVTKGVEIEEMCRRILANSHSWEPVAAMLTAQRQILEEATWRAETKEQIAAIKVAYTV